MPTLSDTLRQRKQQAVTKRGPGGQLTSEAPEEIQSLAGQAGLQAPPTTALGAAALGANSKQQDMMGSPAQKQAALSLATQPVEQGLSGAVRRAQSRTEMTGQEQGQKEKSQDMQNLGSLGDRVTGFIEAQKNKLQAQAQQATATNTLDVAVQDKFQGKDVSSLKQKLQQLRAEPNNMQLMLEVQQAMGYDVNKQLSPAEIDQLYESATDTIARGAAGNVDNDLTVQDLVAQGDLGYTPEQLQDLLGVPQDQLNNMTIGQLRSEIERVGQQEFSNTQQLQQQAQSGQLGQAERGLAQQAAREMSTTGVRATEADYSNIENQIANADKVLFGGQEYQVDELLKDETISGIISDYLNSAPDSPTRQQLEQSEPALMEFINKNKAVLEEATGALQAGTTEFSAIQQANQSLKNVAGIDMAPELAKALIPGFGTMQAQRVDPNSVPFLAAVNAMPTDARKKAAIDSLNAAAEQYTDLPQQLAGLTKEEIQSLSIGKANAPFEKYLKARQLRDNINSIPAGDIGSLVNVAFGETPQGFSQKQLEARKNGAFGIPTGLPVDINNVGNLKNQLLEATPEMTLKQASSGNIPAYEKRQLGNVQVPSIDTPEGFWRTFSGDLASDGSLDANDINFLAERVTQSQDDGLNRLIQLEGMSARNGASIDKQAVVTQRQRLTDAKTDRDIKTASTSGNPVSQVDNFLGLLDAARKDPKQLNPDIITRGLLDTIAHEGNSSAVQIDLPSIVAKATAAGVDTSAINDAKAKWLDATMKVFRPMAPTGKGRDDTLSMQRYEQDVAQYREQIAAARAKLGI